jgi:hypothetical protein
MLRIFVRKENGAQMLTPEERGCAFFKTLCLLQLNTQQRSVDPVQTRNIAALRVLDPYALPVTPSLMSDYKVITPEDVQADVRWETTLIMVTLNIVRQEINRLRILRFALITGQPIIMWRNPLCGKQAAGMTAQEKELLFATHQALTAKYIPGMPITFLDNINPRKGQSNGGRGRLHSLTLDPREDLVTLSRKVRQAKSAEEIALLYPPISVNAELLNADMSKYGPNDTLIQGRAVVPIFQRSRSRYEPIKSWETLSRINPIDGVRYRSHGYEPEFACTMEKGQSKTLESVIIDLNLWPGMHLSFEKFNVALTRVKTRNDVRLMPTLPGQNMDHLFRLRPDPRMLVWRAGFGPNGIWDPERSKAAIDLLPSDFFKKRKQKPSNKKWNPPFQPGDNGSTNSNNDGCTYGRKHTSDSGEKDSLPSKKGIGSRSKSYNGPGMLHSLVPAVTASFKLDQAIPGTRIRVFKSFHVPPDGDCLYHSAKRLLDLSISIAELRAQVVQHMDTLPPVEQINIVNEHLLREPSWQDERLFGDQGVIDSDGNEVIGDILLDSSSLSDVHGDRFDRLWRRYKLEMSDNSWGGNAEMAAIKDLYSVSVVVWQIDSNGVAHQINRINVGRADSRTLHIRWVNEQHYEPTDIPASYLPMPSAAPIPAFAAAQPAVRVSGRARRPRQQFDA